MEFSNLNNLNYKFNSLHNQQISYADFFYNRRILLFSLPCPITAFSWYQLTSYQKIYKELLGLNLDEIYCISCDPLVIPYAESHSLIIPVLDIDSNFTECLKQYSNSLVSLNELSRLWQYVVIVNNGNITQLFSNDIYSNFPLKVFNSSEFQYKNLNAETIKQKLSTADLSKY